MIHMCFSLLKQAYLLTKNIVECNILAMALGEGINKVDAIGVDVMNGIPIEWRGARQVNLSGGTILSRYYSTLFLPKLPGIIVPYIMKKNGESRFTYLSAPGICVDHGPIKILNDVQEKAQRCGTSEEVIGDSDFMCGVLNRFILD